MERLEDLKPGDVLKARHINLLNQSYRAQMGVTGMSGRRGPYNLQASPPEFYQFLVQVTEQMQDDEGNDLDYQYKCKRLYFDDDQIDAGDKWQVSDDEWELDASVYRLNLTVEDELVVYWDSVRGKHIPISPYDLYISSLKRSIDGVVVKDGDDKDEVSSDIADLFRIKDDDGTDVLVDQAMDRTIYNPHPDPVFPHHYTLIGTTAFGARVPLPNYGFWEWGWATAEIEPWGTGSIYALNLEDDGWSGRTKIEEVQDAWGTGAVYKERVFILRHPRSGRLIFQLASWIRLAKADVNIPAGGSGTVSIWTNGVNSGSNCTAFLDWGHSDNGVEAGDSLILWFDPSGQGADSNHWRIIGRSC